MKLSVRLMSIPYNTGVDIITGRLPLNTTTYGFPSWPTIFAGKQVTAVAFSPSQR